VKSRMLLWGTAYFSPSWRFVPFQHILFTTWLVTVLMIIATPNGSLTLSDGINGAPHGYRWAYYGWITLSLLGPIFLWLSSWLIHYRTGRDRYRGYWIRLCASQCQFASMVTYTVSLTHHWAAMGGSITSDDYHLSAFCLLIAIQFFVVLLIIRDAWKCWLIEHVARQMRDGRIDPVTGVALAGIVGDDKRT
jgi:hypothetical protein